MNSEVPFTNLLRCNHHWPLCHAPTLTRLTLTNLTLIPVIMRTLMNLFPVTGRPVRVLRHRTMYPVTGAAYGYAISDETPRPDVTVTGARRGKTVLWMFRLAGQGSGMTWYRATPSAGTAAWIVPADDIWKTLAPPGTTDCCPHRSCTR